ncbi:MAG: HAD family hydrolase [Candidatus Brocadiia bacterium]
MLKHNAGKCKSADGEKSCSKSRRGKACRFRAVIFDLGNTIYDKQYYVESAFKEIIKYLSQSYYLNYQATLDLFYRIWKVRTSHYEFLLENLLNVLGIFSPELMGRLLQIYYNHKSSIRTYRGVPKMLDVLGRKYKLAILTDGNLLMQYNKIRTLGIEDKFDLILCSAEHPKKYAKPNSYCYRLVTEKLNVNPSETVYVGDNPSEDFIGAKQIGIFTVRVLQGEFKDFNSDKLYDADVVIKSIIELPKVI